MSVDITAQRGRSDLPTFVKGKTMLNDLQELLSTLTVARKELILLTAKEKMLPSNNTLNKIAALAATISSVEAVIANSQGRTPTSGLLTLTARR